MAFMNATYRKTQFMVRARTSVLVQESAINVTSISLTGRLLGFPDVPRDQIRVYPASFDNSVVAFNVATMSGGYLYGTAIRSAHGNETEDSVEFPFIVELLIGSRPA